MAASRGHDVVLFEAASRLGGQLILASRCDWRKDLNGIVDWLIAQVDNLGVDVRPNQLAAAEQVLAENPQVVVIATGGVPVVGHFRGADLAVTTWDLLARQVEPGNDVLVFDEAGSHGGLSRRWASGCARGGPGSGRRGSSLLPSRLARCRGCCRGAGSC